MGFEYCLHIEVLTVPNCGIKILSQGKAIENHDRGDGFEHKKENNPEFGT